MALSDQSTNGAVAATETTIITGNAAGTLIKAGAVTITNDTAGTTSNLQVGVIKAGGSRVNMLNYDMQPASTWVNDGDIILEDATDSLVAIAADAATLTYTASYFDDFLA